MYGRTLWVTRRLGNQGRTKLQVFDPAAAELRMIHVLPTNAASKQLRRVLRQTSRMASFVSILDTEFRNGEVWVLTDWICGISLAEHLAVARKNDNLWPTAHMSWTMYARFVHGLSQFHDVTHCVHADIKPANLIVQDELRRYRLIDFGSAWDEERGRSRDSGDGSSVGYAAPEIHENSRPTLLVDQFSATVVLYEMFTGELPYQGMGGRAGWQQYRETFAGAFEPPSQNSSVVSQLPRRAWRQIDEVCRIALSLEPRDRFPTSNEWRDGVDQVTNSLRQLESRSRTKTSVAALIESFVDNTLAWLNRSRRGP